MRDAQPQHHERSIGRQDEPRQQDRRVGQTDLTVGEDR